MDNNLDNSIPPEILADAQAVADCVAAGKPVPADVAQRVHERALQVRQEIFEKHGVLNIGVDIIRELRGELPQP